MCDCHEGRDRQLFRRRRGLEVVARFTSWLIVNHPVLLASSIAMCGPAQLRTCWSPGRKVRPSMLSHALHRGQHNVLRHNVHALARSKSPEEAWQSELPNQLMARKIPLYYDNLSPERSYRLGVSLADHLPGPRCVQVSGNPKVSTDTVSVHASQFITSDPSIVPPAHHFLYCEPTNSSSVLLPDGTNPEQYPGPPFHHRLWAGGSIRYNLDNQLYLSGKPIVCLEMIRDAQCLGLPGQQNITLDIERRLAYLDPAEVRALNQLHTHAQTNRFDAAAGDIEDNIRARIRRDDEADFGPCSLIERRKMVFLQKQHAHTDRDSVSRMIRMDRYEKAFSHSMTPDNHLLFRYSALTFNAHAIHLDPEYSRNVEDRRGLLVHGPLSLTCLISTLESVLRSQGIKRRIASIDYRNLAPLYCHEPIELCGRRIMAGEDLRYEVWAETPTGGVATKAKVQLAT